MAYQYVGLAAWGAAVYAAASMLVPDSIQRITKEEFLRLMKLDVGELEDIAVKEAFSKMGLEIETGKNLSAQSITNAINNGPLAGSEVELTNIFDKESLKRDLTRIALDRAAQTFGLTIKGLSIDEIKTELKKKVSADVMEQARGAGGDLVDNAKDVVELVRQIDAYKNALARREDVGLDMSPEGVDNRERQARYRANHKRVWVSR